MQIVRENGFSLSLIVEWSNRGDVRKNNVVPEQHSQSLWTPTPAETEGGAIRQDGSILVQKTQVVHVCQKSMTTNLHIQYVLDYLFCNGNILVNYSIKQFNYI